MTNDKINAMLAGNTEALVDLNDWAVNTVREFHAENFPHKSAHKLLVEECARIKDGELDLAAYLKAHRGGSSFRLSRKARRAIFALLASRAALSA